MTHKSVRRADICSRQCPRNRRRGNVEELCRMSDLAIPKSLVLAPPTQGWRERSKLCSGAAFLWFHARYLNEMLCHAAGGRASRYVVETLNNEEMLAWEDPGKVFPANHFSAPRFSADARLESFVWDDLPVELRLLEFSDPNRNVHALLKLNHSVTMILMSDSMWCDWTTRGSRHARSMEVTTQVFNTDGSTAASLQDDSGPYTTRFRDGRIAADIVILNADWEQSGYGIPMPKAIPPAQFGDIAAVHVHVQRYGSLELRRCPSGEIQRLIDAEVGVAGGSEQKS
jgi:hypothetical protein